MKTKLLFILFFSIIFYIHAQQSDFKHISFRKADSIASLYKNEKLNNLPLLSYKLTYRLDTDVEKFRAIYIWVCKNIKSDYNLTTKILSKGKKYRNNREAFLKWNTSFRPKFLKKLLEDKKTICTGFAFLVKELSSLANINCTIINGYSKTANFNPKKLFPNHSWNAVQLNNKWYLCDPVFASGYYNLDISTFVHDYNDGYFLTDPNLFIKNHYPEDKKWTLLENKNTNFNDFINAPFIYNETFKYKITPVLPKKIASEISVNENVVFKFKIDSPSRAKQLNLITYNGLRETKFKPTQYTLINNILKFTYRFPKKGLYDVHIKIREDIIASYTIKVMKNNS